MTTADRILRSELSTLKPYNAGLTLEEVKALAGSKNIAKLASNENPYPRLSTVDMAMTQALLDVSLYPDPKGHKLALAIADKVGSHPDQIIFGNGSEDLLNILARSVLRPSDEVVTLYPSFPLHEDYATMMGAKIHRIGLTKDGQIDVDALTEAASRPVRLTLFANPMNPAGLWLNGEELARVLDAQHPDSILCIDEAYLEYAMASNALGHNYVAATDFISNHKKPLLLLRTFSKAFGLAGLRVGYGLTNNAQLKQGLDLVRTPFNVNGIAQAAALAALHNAHKIEPTIKKVISEREKLANSLSRIGVHSLPSAGNFLFVDVGTNASLLAENLLLDGVIVKPWKQEGYENFIRVSIGLPEENSQFFDALSRTI